MDNEKKKTVGYASFKRLGFLPVNYLDIIIGGPVYNSELIIPGPNKLRTLLLKGLTPYSHDPFLGDFPNMLEAFDVNINRHYENLNRRLGEEVIIRWLGFSDSTMLSGKGTIYLDKIKDEPGYIPGAALFYNFPNEIDEERNYYFVIDGKKPLVTIKELWNFLDWIYDPGAPHEDYPEGTTETEDYTIELQDNN